MKNVMSALAVAVLLSTPVWAANRGANPPPNRTANEPQAPRAPAWTGCYVDAGVGYGLFNQKQHTETFPGLAPTTAGDFDDGGNGWLGRMGAGCDYQLTGSLRGTGSSEHSVILMSWASKALTVCRMSAPEVGLARLLSLLKRRIMPGMSEAASVTSLLRL